MAHTRPHHHSPRRLLSPHRATRLALITLVTVLVSALAGACSPTAPTSPDAGAQRAPTTTTAATTAAAGAPRAALTEVCGRFTIAALSSDTAIDQGPGNARKRAATQFGTPELITQFAAGEGRDHTWPDLIAHQGRVVVDIAPVDDDPPPARGNTVGAAVLATRLAVGDDGWRQPLPGLVAYCSLVIGEGGWKVSAVSFSDTSTSGGAPR